MKELYKYRNLPLSPTIVEELILLLFEGQVTTRETIISEIKKYHISKGGIDDNVDLVSQFKKASGSLKKKGLIENPQYRYFKTPNLKRCYQVHKKQIC